MGNTNFAVSQLSPAWVHRFCESKKKEGGRGEANKNELCQSITIKTPIKLKPLIQNLCPIRGCYLPHGLIYPWQIFAEGKRTPWYFWPGTLQKCMACLSSTPMLFNPFFTLFLLLMEKNEDFHYAQATFYWYNFTGKTSVPTDWKTGLKCTWVSMALVSGMTFLSFNKIFHHFVTVDLYKYPYKYS